jgi:hypothetical protein
MTSVAVDVTITIKGVKGDSACSLVVLWRSVCCMLYAKLLDIPARNDSQKKFETRVRQTSSKTLGFWLSICQGFWVSRDRSLQVVRALFPTPCRSRKCKRSFHLIDNFARQHHATRIMQDTAPSLLYCVTISCQQHLILRYRDGAGDSVTKGEWNLAQRAL